MDKVKKQVEKMLVTNFKSLSADTLNWITIIIGHSIFIPTMLAMLTDISDRVPTVDIILLVWAMLFVSFYRSVILKDMVAITLHGLGLFTQGTILALVLFK